MDIESYFDCADDAAAWLAQRSGVKPKAIVVLSAGLSGFVDHMQSKKEIASSDIPHFPGARAEGHEGRLVFGTMRGMPLVAMVGRFHFYEGHSPQEVVFPHFVFAKLGARLLITTNAVGGVNRKFAAGDLMLVRDHINMMGINPLVGVAVQRGRDQFTSMIDAYDPKLRIVAKKAARKLKIPLKEGVYLATSGPSYETRAEVAAFRKFGADAVGMSTVPEVIAARFLGLRVLSLSCIANPAADLHRGRMTHAEVLSSMRKLAPRAAALLEEIVGEADKE
ncbi:MAG: purine-nucleoside phosphorylase [bacterium]